MDALSATETLSRTDKEKLLSVVVPVFCEADRLRSLLETLCPLLDTLPLRYEILIIDDGSHDATWSAIVALRSEFAALQGYRLSRNFGKEAALTAGLEVAAGDLVLVMDGDLQHPPSLVPAMLAQWQSGADVVEAIKVHRGKESAFSRMRAELFYVIFRRLTGYDLQGASDFKLMNRQVLDAWRRMGERSLFFRGMHAWLGFRRARVEFSVPERAGGDSRWSLLALSRLALTAVTAFSSAPLHFVTLAGGMFMIFAFLLGAQTLYLKLTGAAVDGFTTVIFLLLIIGSILMFGLGVIGMYVARIYEEVKGRPRYVIAERTR